MANEFKIKTGLLLGAPTTQPVTSIKDTSTSITADASSLLVTGKAIYDFHTANSAGSSYWELDGSTLVLTDESVDVKLSSIEIGADAGVVTLIEMDVSVSAVEESYAFNIDGTTIAKVYAEGDGTGGILEPAFKVVESFIAESSVYMSGITEVSTGYTLYYNPTSHVVTYAEASLGGGGTTDASLGSLTDVSINDASLYDIITPNADGNWVNQQKEWYTDSSLIQPVNSDYDVQLASIEIVEDAGAITIIDMPISSTPAVGTEESYAFNMSGNLVAKIWSEADGAGDASITGLVVETAQYMGDPNTNGSWRFYVTDDASADLVFEKLISGTWTQKGKFTE